MAVIGKRITGGQSGASPALDDLDTSITNIGKPVSVVNRAPGNSVVNRNGNARVDSAHGLGGFVGSHYRPPGNGQHCNVNRAKFVHFRYQPGVAGMVYAQAVHFDYEAQPSGVSRVRGKVLTSCRVHRVSGNGANQRRAELQAVAGAEDIEIDTGPHFEFGFECRARDDDSSRAGHAFQIQRAEMAAVVVTDERKVARSVVKSFQIESGR